LTGFQLAVVLLVGSGMRGAEPTVSFPPLPAVDQRIEDAVDSTCAGARAQRVTAIRVESREDWTRYAQDLSLCADHQTGLLQARILTEAVFAIESLLDSMPDTYGSARWRAKADELVERALPGANTDIQLVAILKDMHTKMTTNVRRSDLKPNAGDVAPGKLVPAGAIEIGKDHLSAGDMDELWFTLAFLGLPQARAAIREHLAALGWTFCPPENPNGPRDVVEVHFIGPSPTPDPHLPRKADALFDASLRNEWDITVELFGSGANSTNAVLFVNPVDFEPVCSPYKYSP
jgi:hypothetical protein